MGRHVPTIIKQSHHTIEGRFPISLLLLSFACLIIYVSLTFVEWNEPRYAAILFIQLIHLQKETLKWRELVSHSHNFFQGSHRHCKSFEMPDSRLSIGYLGTVCHDFKVQRPRAIKFSNPYKSSILRQMLELWIPEQGQGKIHKQKYTPVIALRHQNFKSWSFGIYMTETIKQPRWRLRRFSKAIRNMKDTRLRPRLRLSESLSHDAKWMVKGETSFVILFNGWHIMFRSVVAQPL